MSELSTPWQDWVLQDVLGEGNFGMVYRACHASNEHLQSAVKIIEIPSDPAETGRLSKDGYSAEQIARFYQERTDGYCEEIRLQTQCAGVEQIVNIEDFRVEPRQDGPGSIIYIRMELLKSLRDYLSDKHPTEDEVIQLGIDICRALEVCHGKSILHHDIKPNNIFVRERTDGTVSFKLGDFGSARIQDSDQESLFLQGSLAYMAPEISEGEADPRSDLYTLGLTLYRLMNENRLPFLPPRQILNYDDHMVAYRMRMTGAPLPAPSEASPEIADIILRACARDKQDRFESAGEMRKALEALSAKRVRERQRERKKEERAGRQERTIRIWLAVISVMLALILGGILTEYLAKEQAADSAEPTKIPLIPAEEKEEDAYDILTGELKNLWEEMNFGFDRESGYLIPKNLRILRALTRIEQQTSSLQLVRVGENGLHVEDPEGKWIVSLDEETKTVSLILEKWISNRNRVYAEFGYDMMDSALVFCQINYFGAAMSPEKSIHADYRVENLIYLFCLQPEGQPRVLIWYDGKGNFKHAQTPQGETEDLEQLEEEGMNLI